MSKVIKGYNYKKVSVKAENRIDVYQLTEVNANTGRKGDLGFTGVGETFRIVLYSNVLQILDNPSAVKFFIGEDIVAIVPVPPDTNGAYSVMKNGIIYDSNLAGTLMSLAKNVEFKPNCTTRCGRIDTVQENEDGTSTVIISFA